MDVKNCIYNAFYDLKCKPSYAFRMIRGVSFILVMIQITLVVSSVIQDYYKDIIYDLMPDNAVIHQAFLDENGRVTSEEKELIKKLENIEKTGNASCWFGSDLIRKKDDSDHRFIRMERVTSVFGGEQCIFDECYAGTSFHTSVYIEGYEIINDNFEKLFLQKYPDKSIMLFGREPLKNNEIALSEKMLRCLGIESSEEVLGKKISFYIDGEIYISDALLSGIVSDDYVNMLSEMVFFYSDIFFVSSFSDIEKYAGGEEDLWFYMPINDFSDNTDVFSELESSGLDLDVFGNKLLFTERKYVEQIKEMAEYILGFLCSVIILGMSLSLYSVISSHTASCTGYFGMLCAIGMKRSSLFVSYLFEQVILSVVSIVVSFPVYEMFVILIGRFSSCATGAELDPSMKQVFSTAVLSGFLTVMIVIILSSLVFRRFMSKNTVVLLAS